MGQAFSFKGAADEKDVSVIVLRQKNSSHSI
jgi:hypothetical protein